MVRFIVALLALMVAAIALVCIFSPTYDLFGLWLIRTFGFQSDAPVEAIEALIALGAAGTTYLLYRQSPLIDKEDLAQINSGINDD